MDNSKMIVFLRRYQGSILFGILCFYLGCGISLSFLRVDCITDLEPVYRKVFSNPANETEYAILILTAPKNQEQRHTIRTTWGNFIRNIYYENGQTLYKWNKMLVERIVKHDVVKMYFAVGIQNLDKPTLAKIESEDKKYKDLLIFHDFEDGYNKLSSKLMLSLDWLNKNLNKLKYVIKSDDDSFMRVDLIVSELEAYAPEMNGEASSKFISHKDSQTKYKGLYWGYFNGRASVYQKGKWQEGDWFLCDTYLPYALGGGYVISRSIVDYVSRNMDILSTYTSEDVSMGVWTAALDGINRVHDTRFDTEWISRGCDNSMLVRHKQGHSDMVQMYSNLVTSSGTKLCTTDYTSRKSYIYNWKVLPSSCCIKT